MRASKVILVGLFPFRVHRCRMEIKLEICQQIIWDLHTRLRFGIHVFKTSTRFAVFAIDVKHLLLGRCYLFQFRQNQLDQRFQ